MGFSFQTTKELRLQEVEDTLGMKNEMKTRQTPVLAVPLICWTVFYVFNCSGFEKANRLVHF